MKLHEFRQVVKTLTDDELLAMQALMVQEASARLVRELEKRIPGGPGA